MMAVPMEALIRHSLNFYGRQITATTSLWETEALRPVVTSALSREACALGPSRVCSSCFRRRTPVPGRAYTSNINCVLFRRQHWRPAAARSWNFQLDCPAMTMHSAEEKWPDIPLKLYRFFSQQEHTLLVAMFFRWARLYVHFRLSRMNARLGENTRSPFSAGRFRQRLCTET